MSERSKGGSEILRHKAREGGFEPAFGGDDAASRAVEEHFARHVGEAEHVFHEIISHLVHIDVHVVPPTNGRDVFTLFTTDMSDRPMNVPDGYDGPKLAELMIRLPRSWQLSQSDFENERWYWPVRWLKTLARLPHEFDTWLGTGHTIPNGDPAEPLGPGTRMSGFIMLPPVSLPEHVVKTPRGPLSVLAMVPIYADEMDLKLRGGASALVDRFAAANVSDMIDIERASVAARKKWLGLF
jgi:Suppressor of fused protein (SUFU)